MMTTTKPRHNNAGVESETREWAYMLLWEKNKFRWGFIVLLLWIAAAWACTIEAALVDRRSEKNLLHWGIWPRHARGLFGILTAPFVHVGYGHLAANCFAIVVLGSLLVLRGMAEFLGFLLWIAGIGGLGVWAVGRDEYIHVGASGVLFGVFAVLLAAPIVERPFRPLNFVSALVGGLIYGGMFFGFFGSDGKVSYESHICGFASGLLGAVMYFYLWQRVLRPKVGQDGRVVTVGRPEQKWQQQQKKSAQEAGMDVELGHVGGNPFDEDDEEDLGPLEEPDDLNRYVVA
ncbi:Rhomboid family intramembrane serine protease [Balamuthia mandrillaris]